MLKSQHIYWKISSHTHKKRQAEQKPECKPGKIQSLALHYVVELIVFIS